MSDKLVCLSLLRILKRVNVVIKTSIVLVGSLPISDLKVLVTEKYPSIFCP
jgi:hypothetical protein